MREQGLPLGDGTFRSHDKAILSGPRIEAPKQEPVDFEEVRIGDARKLREKRHRIRQIGAEKLVLDTLHDPQIFLACGIAEITRGREILEGVKHPSSPSGG